MRAVADSGPIIHLSWIGQLGLLPALFDEVLVPPLVEQEVLRGGPDAPGVDAVRMAFAAGWLLVRTVVRRDVLVALPPALHGGEAEAIALYEPEGADLLLLDDRRARTEAARRSLRVTGTIGVLREAHHRQLIAAFHPLVLELRRRGFRIGGELLERLSREDDRRDAGAPGA